jgi:hypothetical protein
MCFGVDTRDPAAERRKAAATDAGYAGELTEAEQKAYQEYFDAERAAGRNAKNIQNVYDWRKQQRDYSEAGLPSTLPAETSLAPPDLTDSAVTDAQRLQMQRLLAGRGRRSSFLTGPLGAPGPGLNRNVLGG